MHPYLCFSRIYLCEAITSLSPKGINMKTAVGSIILASILTTGAAGAATVNVGGAAMLPQKNIVENALNSKDHTTLVAAVKAAGLVDTLQGKGPFTVFAPTNAAFSGLPAGTVDTLLKPDNKSQLTKILTYHVVPGKYTKHDLEKLIKKDRSEEHTSELQSLMRISYAVFCLKKKKSEDNAQHRPQLTTTQKA